MTRTDFLNIYAEYIDTLKGSGLTENQLHAWIKRDAEIWKENISEQEIQWIIEEINA